ncbi:hypothetical protein [Streptomyces sp. NPDC054887]
MSSILRDQPNSWSTLFAARSGSRPRGNPHDGHGRAPERAFRTPNAGSTGWGIDAGQGGQELRIDATLPGRVFTSGQPHHASADDGTQHW